MQANSSSSKHHSFKNRVVSSRRYFQKPQEKIQCLAFDIEFIVKKMRKRREEVLEKHMHEIYSLRNSLSSSCIKDSQILNALVNKEQELHHQRSEFIMQCEQLESRIKHTESVAKFQSITPVIEKEFAIECMRLKIGYPIYAHRSKIVESVMKNQVSIVLGETGSGKSTQLVQYFDEAGLSQHGLIVCTQPRKIAALSVAKFVATELGTVLGQVVGYRAGHKQIMNKQTRILFMSDYEMFCEFQKDKHLTKYSCLIVDEVHERSIYTDLLLAMVKSYINLRPEFKLVVMSATIDPRIFQSYFPQSHLVNVPGRTFPVDVIWKNPSKTVETESSYEDEAIRKAITVHEMEKEGDILVFVTTPKETEFCSSKLKASLSARNDYICLSLHGRLDADEQQKVFNPPPEGKRKIVFATNCAETSITIPNIKYVIDTGFAKELFFDEVSKIDTLAIRRISRSSADQRKGRAGRTSAGKCFRLYTQDDYTNMNESTMPEILCIHPAKAALKLFQMGSDPLDFDFLQAPPANILSDAVNHLNSLGAISDKKITPLGNQIAELPFEPQMNLFILKGIEQEMTKEAVSIACLNSFSGNIFYRGRNDEEMENNKKKQLRFHSNYGDLISLLLVLQEYFNEDKAHKRRWCLANAINGKTLGLVCEKMKEVFDILRHKLQYKFSFPSKLTFNEDSIAKLLFTCFECNTCIYLGHQKAGYLALNQNKYVYIHPSSSIRCLNLNPPLIIFQTLMSTSRDFAFTVLSIQESWLKNTSLILQKEITEAESQIVKLVFQRGLGEQFARCLFGPKYSNLKQMENEIRQVVNNEFVYIDFSKGRTELRVYSRENISAKVKCLVEENILCPVNKQQEEFKEIKIDDNNLAPKVVIESGGCIKGLVMPYESRTVIVKDVPVTAEIGDVRKKLEEFGKIVNLKTFNSSSNGNRWGCVTFETLASAKECLSSTSSDSEIITVPCSSYPKNFSQCSAELTWTRRPIKGIGFVKFTNMEDFLNISRNLHDYYNLRWRIRINKKNTDELYLTSVPKDTNEEEIKRYFTEKYNLEGDIQVILPRIQKNYMADEENQVRNRIDIQLKRFFDSYAIKLNKINAKDFFYKAYIEFPSNQVIPTESIYLRLEEQLVKFIPKFSSQILITSKLYEILKDDINKEIINIKTKLSGTLSFEARKLKNGNFSLALNSNSAEKLNCAKTYLNEVTMGDKIEIGVSPATRVLFSKEGRIFLEELEKKIEGSSIFLDCRHMYLRLQGNEAVRTELKVEVNRFIDHMLNMMHKIFNLHDDGRPKGLKRELILRYGVDLDKLRTELNLAQIQLHRNTVEARGCTESLEKLDKLLYELPGLCSATNEDEIDCVVCFCPVQLESFYRIESCGHPYCPECLKQMVHLALQERIFPMECSEDGCNMKMCWKDFDNFCKMGLTVQKKLVSSSFAHFITANTNKYHYCITPDCHTVYQITTTGEPYICYQCQATICTTCHIDYHFGLTCKMYESSKNSDKDLEKFMQEDYNNRRKCPNCKNIIIKDGGCQHVACSCGIHICWNCMDTFVSSTACYGHLYSKHLSFV